VEQWSAELLNHLKSYPIIYAGSLVFEAWRRQPSVKFDGTAPMHHAFARRPLSSVLNARFPIHPTQRNARSVHTAANATD